MITKGVNNAKRNLKMLRIMYGNGYMCIVVFHHVILYLGLPKAGNLENVEKGPPFGVKISKVHLIIH